MEPEVLGWQGLWGLARKKLREYTDFSYWNQQQQNDSEVPHWADL